jgi:hypothetical protein
MVPNNECEKCAEVEDYKHLIWECYFVRKTWKNLNNILKINNLECDTVNSYQDLFNFRISPATNTIRLKIIQHFIQIKRQTDLGEEKIQRIIDDIIVKEKYIAIKNKRLKAFLHKWRHFI